LGSTVGAGDRLRFPRAACISLNDEALHGLPGPRIVQAGDLIKHDVTAEKEGYMADAALTAPVPPVRNEALRLSRCAERAFQRGLEAARAYHRVWEIGMALEREVKSEGFSVMPEFCGHGIGRTIREEQLTPNCGDVHARQQLTPGLVVTVEPIIAAGLGRDVLSQDGWTVKTADGSLARTTNIRS
jgi:methionyl aminopeptidase